MVVEDVARDFVAITHRVVWCSMATVGPTGRPRSRVLHPYWEMTGAHVRGWVVTRPTPLKFAHLAHCPYVSCSYWDPSHDTAVAECAASWQTDPRERERVWELFRAATPPLGYDFAAPFPDGPNGGTTAVLQLDPWLLRVHTAADLAAGRPPRIWQPPAAA
jgi:hypothetical protein